MALTADSTRDEVLAEIIDNLGYRESNSVTMARALVKAYDHFLLKFAGAQMQNGQSLAQFDIRAQYSEIRNKAESWAEQQGSVSASRGRVKAYSFENFRE
jgi:hypothetical protein